MKFILLISQIKILNLKLRPGKKGKLVKCVKTEKQETLNQ